MPNGGTFTSSFTRSFPRPDLVTRRDYRFGGGSIYWYESGYDLAGRPTNAVDSVSLARAYFYNRRNELAEAMVGTNSLSYAYDSIGNRTCDTFNAVTRNYAANSLNQYTQVDAAQMTYDADGNLTGDGRFAYTYDAENRMVSARPVASCEIANACGDNVSKALGIAKEISDAIRSLPQNLAGKYSIELEARIDRYLNGDAFSDNIEDLVADITGIDLKNAKGGCRCACRQYYQP